MPREARAPRATSALFDRTDLLLARSAEETDPDRRHELLNEVVVLNLPAARGIARRYRDRGLPLEDLEQTACLALVRAARAFDPARGRPFLAYALPCVSGAVKRHFRDLGWTIRPPRSVQELQPRVDAEREVIDEDTGDTPSSSVIARRLAVSSARVEEALSARGCFTPTSLDLEVGGADGSTLGDLIAADGEADFEAADARLVLGPALSSLSEADRRVLVLRFVEGRSQRDTGLALGLSQPDVSRLVTRILRDLQRQLAPDLETSCAAAR